MVTVVAGVLILQLASAGEAAGGQLAVAWAGQLGVVAYCSAQGTVTQAGELAVLANIAGDGELRWQLGHQEEAPGLLQAPVLSSVDGVESVQTPTNQSSWTRAEILVQYPGGLMNSILTPTTI